MTRVLQVLANAHLDPVYCRCLQMPTTTPCTAGASRCPPLPRVLQVLVDTHHVPVYCRCLRMPTMTTCTWTSYGPTTLAHALWCVGKGCVWFGGGSGVFVVCVRYRSVPEEAGFQAHVSPKSPCWCGPRSCTVQQTERRHDYGDMTKGI